MTADPAQIDGIFIRAWRSVYVRPPDESPPSYGEFDCDYGDYITRIPEVDIENFDAPELMAATKRLRKGSAPSMDGWSPDEQMLLPRPAWDDRVRVEQTILRHQTVPDCYLDHPISMIRKNEDRTPLDHRGITVLAVNYRIVNNAIWCRLAAPLRQWAHHGAHGGLPEREFLTAALGVQLAFESAMLNKEDLGMTSMDYSKFFDMFDPSFFRQLKCAIGLSSRRAALDFDMNSRARKRFKIKGNYGEPFRSNRGAGSLTPCA